MLFNYILGIYCFKCKRYLDPYTEVYLSDGNGNESRIKCLKCDEDVGFTWDLAWREFWKEQCKYYYQYHNKGQCRCVQEETNCNGDEKNCENKLGKKCYEDDLKEDKNDKSN